MIAACRNPSVSVQNLFISSEPYTFVTVNVDACVVSNIYLAFVRLRTSESRL